MERTIKLYGNKVYGVEVSKYGLENGYLDYLTLSKIVGFSENHSKTKKVKNLQDMLKYPKKNMRIENPKR